MSSARGRSAWAVLLLLWAAGVGDALAQQSVDVDDLPLLSPSRRLPVQDAERVVASAISPDEQKVYFQIQFRALNIWALVVYVWPEIAAGLCGLTVLIVLLSGIHVLRYPRFVGKPHCRKCGYCLEGCASGRCPECGRPANRPVRGRSTPRRLLPRAGLLVLASATAMVPWIFPKLPRRGWMSDYFGWWSVALADRVDSKHDKEGWYWASCGYVSRLDVLDLGIDEQRTLCRWPSDSYTFTLSPNSQTAVLPGPRGVRLIDTQTGHTRRSLSWFAMRHYLAAPLVLFSEDSRIAHINYIDAGRGLKSVLLAWDLPTGGKQVLTEHAVDLDG